MVEQDKRLSLYFDDNGEKLEAGDFVMINDEIVTMIKIDQEVERKLAAIGDTEVVSISKVSN